RTPSRERGQSPAPSWRQVRNPGRRRSRSEMGRRGRGRARGGLGWAAAHRRWWGEPTHYPKGVSMTAQTEPKLSLTVQAPKGERKPMAIYVGLGEGTDPHNPASLTEPCVEMYPIPNPEVAKVLNRRGITRTGPYSWAFGKVAHP